MERYLQAHADSLAVSSARSAAAANVRDAQLEVAEAQQQLGDLVGAVAGELPLSVDRPHVGSYTTLFEKYFAGRPAPPRMRLIHRTLPIRRQAIDAHGAAIVATLDAVEATGDEFASAGQGLTTLLMLFDRLHDERQQFMSAVRQYNDAIAEYWFAVASPGTSDEMLVSRLILTKPAATRPDLSPDSRLAPQPNERPAPPRTFDTTPAEGGAPGGQPTVAEPESKPQTSNYQQADVEALVANGGGLYQGLIEMHPPARVQKLSGLLHWDRATPSDADRPIGLAECLRDVSYSERLALLTAYWQACEAAARHQMLSDEVEQLNSLTSILSTLGHRPDMAAAGVRFQAARRAVRAEALEAQLALVDAEYELTQVAHQQLENSWLLPSTPPQAGRYVVAERDTGAARHAGEAVVARHAELEARADAVLRADLLRASVGGDGADAAAAMDAPGELTSLDRAIWAIDHQSRQTQAFLRNLTEYNIAIARYALTHLPTGIPSDELVKKLVIVRNERDAS